MRSILIVIHCLRLASHRDYDKLAIVGLHSLLQTILTVKIMYM